jgi:hypothetical protein
MHSNFKVDTSLSSDDHTIKVDITLWPVKAIEHITVKVNMWDPGPTMNDLLNKLNNKQKKLSSVTNPRKRARLEDKIWHLEEEILNKI